YRQSPNEVIQRAMSDEREIVTMHWEPATGTISYSRQDDPLVKVPTVGVDPRTVLSPDVFRVRVGNVPDSTLQQLTSAQRIVSSVSSFLRERFFFISAFRGGAELFLSAQSGEDPRWVGTNGS